jgi:hypothetical protein
MLRMGENALVIRTDFSDDAVWATICYEMQRPREFGFRAKLDFLSDRDYEGMTVDELVALAPESHTFFLVVDSRTVTDPEHPFLVVDYFDRPARTLRAIPAVTWSVENNLSIANMDFDDFLTSADPDGVFRGY